MRGFPPRDLPEGERSVVHGVLSALGPRLPDFGPHCLSLELGEGGNLRPTASEDRVPCEAETREVARITC